MGVLVRSSVSCWRPRWQRNPENIEKSMAPRGRRFQSGFLMVFVSKISSRGDIKSIKKLLWNRLPLGAALCSIFSGFRCHLGRQHDTRDLAKTPQHFSRGHPRAAQELCQTAQEPCKTAFKTRPKRPRPPRTSKTLKISPKVDGVPLQAWVLGLLLCIVPAAAKSQGGGIGRKAS